MALSLKTIASNCLSLSPPFSVIRDVFGYLFRDNNGNIFDGQKRTMSLKRQLTLIQGPSLDINLIFVGKFGHTDYAETQHAVQFTRDIYAKVNLGVRKINWLYLSEKDAGSYVTIDSAAEATDLTDDWNGPTGALDVFVVRVCTYADGRSATFGPCSKNKKDQMTGSVVSLNGSFNNSGNTFAHEIGHYLGLKHSLDPNNFIGGSPPGASNANTGINKFQGMIMKAHCYVSDIC